MTPIDDALAVCKVEKSLNYTHIAQEHYVDRTTVSRRYRGKTGSKASAETKPHCSQHSRGKSSCAISMVLIVPRPHFRFSSFLPPPKVGANYTYNHRIYINTFLNKLLKPFDYNTKMRTKYNLLIKFKLLEALKYIEQNLNIKV